MKKPKKLNPLMRFLLAFYPFGKDFRELGLIGKIYEILKVSNTEDPVRIGIVCETKFPLTAHSILVGLS